MTAITPTSELEAVNLMLGAIGESPVNSLSVSGLEDVATARSILSKASRTVQSKGWYFNTLKNYTLVTEANSPYNIYLPTNCLSFQPTGVDGYKNLVQRGNRVYDGDNHTFTFGGPIKSELIILLPFDELPETARAYISVQAGRLFGQRTVGSVELDGFSQVDELEARGNFRREAARASNRNLLTGNYTVYRTLDRRSNVSF